MSQGPSRAKAAGGGGPVVINRQQNVAVAASHQANGGGAYETSTGYTVRFRPVSANLVDEITARIPTPRIPMWLNEEKGREEPNPGDPIYLEALKEADHARGVAAMNALLIRGVELTDPDYGRPDTWQDRIPAGTDTTDEYLLMAAYWKFAAAKPADRFWLRELAMSGVEVDQEDPFALRLAFLRYIAVCSPQDLAEVMTGCGVSAEALAQATASFRGNT